MSFDDWWQHQNPDHYDEISARAAWSAGRKELLDATERAAVGIRIALAHMSPHQPNVRDALEESLEIVTEGIDT